MGRKETEAMIWRTMRCISFWISIRVFGLGRDSSALVSLVLSGEASSTGSSRVTSNSQRSIVSPLSLRWMTRTSRESWPASSQARVNNYHLPASALHGFFFCMNNGREVGRLEPDTDWPRTCSLIFLRYSRIASSSTNIIWRPNFFTILKSFWSYIDLWKSIVLRA